MIYSKLLTYHGANYEWTDAVNKVFFLVIYTCIMCISNFALYFLLNYNSGCLLDSAVNFLFVLLKIFIEGWSAVALCPSGEANMEVFS